MSLLGAVGWLMGACLGLAADPPTRALEIDAVPRLWITGPIGSTNEIQYVDALGGGPWQTLTNVVLSGNPHLFVDSTVPRGTTRFYRTVGKSLIPNNPDPENLVWISPGTFAMGTPDSDLNSLQDPSQTAVLITQGFWMGRHEVRQETHLEVMGSNPSFFKGDLRRPVEMVSWNDATNFCARLTERERLAGRLPDAYAYRLPTEAEWEYAARAGTTTRFSHGDDLNYIELWHHAWYFHNSESTTHPVGQKLANPWGLHDMSGNVWEWCSDWAGPYPGGSVTDPKGPSTGSHRVVRGGSYFDAPWFCWSAQRGIDYPGGGGDFANNTFGFRVVLAPAQP